MTKNYIIFLLSAALIIIVLFFTCEKPPKPIPIITVPNVITVMDTVWGDTTKFYKESLKLNKRIDSLTNRLGTTKHKLSEAEQTVNNILNNLPKNDTTYLLKQIIITKDSLTHRAFVQLDSIIVLKDSQFIASQRLKSDLLKSINLLEQGSLQKDDIIKYWRKEAKKQKRNKVLFKIATGVAAIFIINKVIQ